MAKLREFALKAHNAKTPPTDRDEHDAAVAIGTAQILGGRIDGAFNAMNSVLP